MNLLAASLNATFGVDSFRAAPVALPAHLDPANGIVAQRADGWWFITAGHAGFNTAVNNSTGYGTKEIALTVHARLLDAAARRR